MGLGAANRNPSWRERGVDEMGFFDSVFPPREVGRRGEIRMLKGTPKGLNPTGSIKVGKPTQKGVRAVRDFVKKTRP